MALNLGYLLHESAKTHPDKPALLFDGGSLTFAEVDRLSDQMAATLRAKGFGVGDRIGLQLPNLPQFVIAYFAILKAGCVVVPMNAGVERLYVVSTPGAPEVTVGEPFEALFTADPNLPPLMEQCSRLPTSSGSPAS